MQHVLFVNPKDRNERAKPVKTKKHRSAKQRANDRRLGQMARARAAGARKSNPTKGTTMKRKTRHVAKRHTPAKRHSAPAKRHKSRSRRRNPISIGAFARPMSFLKPALIGAAGAVIVNTALNKFSSSLPTAMTTGNAMYATRALAGIALGYVAGKMGAGGAIAAKLAEGSLTVTFHDMIVNMAGDSMGLAGAGRRANNVSRYVRSAANPASQPFVPGVAGVNKYLPPSAGPFQPNGVLQAMPRARAGIPRGR